MRFLRTSAIVFCLCLSVAFLPSGWAGDAAARTPYRTRNVIILVMDGARYTETWGDPRHQYVPRLAELAKDGVVNTSFRNTGDTTTNSGHTAIVAGFYQQVDNHGRELPAHPTYFQVWRKATGAPASAAWVITAKDKLFILGDSADPEWHGKFTASTDCGTTDAEGVHHYRSDPATWQAVKKVLARDHPHLVLINFKDPDERGHLSDWPGYLKAIQQTDQYASDLWQLLQQDPAYAGTTTLFVTNDHGRHLDGVADGFVNHGCACEGCQHILLFAFGPDFKRGAVVDTPRGLIDFAPTIAALLGFPLPGLPGHVMTELFAPQPAAPREVEKKAEPVLEPVGQ